MFLWLKFLVIHGACLITLLHFPSVFTISFFLFLVISFLFCPLFWELLQLFHSLLLCFASGCAQCSSIAQVEWYFWAWQWNNLLASNCGVLCCPMVWIMEHGWGMCVQQDGGGVSYINNNSPLDEDGQPSLLSHATRVSPATVSLFACCTLTILYRLGSCHSSSHWSWFSVQSVLSYVCFVNTMFP